MVKVLDLFAGAGGWDVAARQLGHEVAGVENWGPAIATRTANDLPTLFHDVWAPFEDTELGQAARTGLFGFYPVLTRGMLIASPSCKPFSLAGPGHGRAAVGDLKLALAHYAETWTNLMLDPEQTLASAVMAAAQGLRRYTSALFMEPDVANVLVPLLYIDWLLPEYILLEQVPSVLPVWEAYVEQLTQRGYNVSTEVLDAAAYGVPQNRKRAVLMARRDGRAPGKPALVGQQTIEDALPGRRGWKLRSNYGTSGDKDNRGQRFSDQPSFTVTGKVNRNKWVWNGIFENVTPQEAAILQTFPPTFWFAGKVNEKCEQIGNAVPPLLAKRLLEAVTS